MNKATALLILFLLMHSTVCSQSGYPKTVVIGKDTVVAITRHQQREILKTYNRADFLKKEIDLLRYSDSAATQRIAELIAILARYEALIANYKAQSDALKTATTSLSEEVRLLKKQNRLARAKLIVTSVATPVGAGGAGFLIGYYLSKRAP